MGYVVVGCKNHPWWQVYCWVYNIRIHTKYVYRTCGHDQTLPLIQPSGRLPVPQQWRKICCNTLTSHIWSKHKVMFQYVLVLMVKACQIHKVHRMAARPPLFARKSPAGQPMWHSNLMSLFLSIPDTWTTELVKAVNLSWWTILLRKYENDHLLNFHCQVVLPMGKLTFLLVTMCSWVKSILWWQNPIC